MGIRVDGMDSNGYYNLIFYISGNVENVTGFLFQFGTYIPYGDGTYFYATLDEYAGIDGTWEDDIENPFVDIQLGDIYLNVDGMTVYYQQNQIQSLQDVDGASFTLNGTMDICALKVKLKSELDDTVYPNDTVKMRLVEVNTGDAVCTCLKVGASKELADINIADEIELASDISSSGYTITYQSQYGTPPTGSINATSIPSQLPTMDDIIVGNTTFEFVGWEYSDGSAVTPGEIINSDVTLNAVWNAIQTTVYTVTFDANGGSISNSTISGILDTIIDDEPIPTYSGHTFAGWYCDNTPVSFPYTIKDNVTLVAKWYDSSQVSPVQSNKVVLNKTEGNSFDVIIYNYSNNLILEGSIIFDFGDQATVKTFTSSGIFDASYGSNNELSFSAVEGINNRFIVVGNIVLQKVDNSVSVTVTPSITESDDSFENDLSGYAVETLTFEFVMDENTPYFYLEVEPLGDGYTYNINIYLHNPTGYLVNGFEVMMSMPTGLSMKSFEPNEFNQGSFNLGNGTISFCFAQADEYASITQGSLDIFLGSLRVINESIDGYATIGFNVNDDPYNYIMLATNYGYAEEVLNLEYRAVEYDFTYVEVVLDDDTSLQIQINDGEIISLDAENNTYTFDEFDSSVSMVDLIATVNAKASVKYLNGTFTNGGLVKEDIVLVAGSSISFTLTVQAENGDEVVYTITIPRAEQVIVDPADVKLVIADTSKNYDQFYEGLIAFDVYIENAAYDIKGADLYLDFDTNVFKLSSKYTSANNFSMTVNSTDNYVSFYCSTVINSSSIYLGRINFEIISSLISAKNYSFNILTEEDYSVILSSGNVTYGQSDINPINATLTIETGYEPVINEIKITKKGNSDIIISDLFLANGDYTCTKNGTIVIPTLDYEYESVDLYLYATGCTIVIEGASYSAPYNVDFSEVFEQEFNVVLSTTGSFTSREYTISLTRDEGDSTSTLDSISFAYGDDTTTLNKFTQASTDSYEATISDIRFIDRNGVVVTASRTSDLSTVVFDDDVTGLTNTYDLVVGNNTIVITVTSQNGHVSTYTITLEVDDKVKAVIASTDVLGSYEFGTSLTKDSFNVTKATLYGEEISNFDTTVVLKDSTDEVITSAVNVGTYKVSFVINSSDDYNQSEEVVATFEIVALDLPESALDDLEVVFAKDKYTYTGSVIMPEVASLTYNSSLLSTDDYEIVGYGDESTNVNASENTAYVTIRGINNYSFVKDFFFTISPKSLLDSDVSTSVSSKNYTAEEIVLDYDDITITIGSEDNLVTLGNSDYSIVPTGTYKEAGNYTVTLSALSGNYTGSKTISFTINQTEMTTDNTEVVIVGADESGQYSAVYTGSAIKPAIQLLFNGIVITSDQYDVTYLDNTLVGQATIKVAAKSGKSLTGNAQDVYFTINALSLADNSDITYDLINDQTYTGNEIKPVPTIYYKGSVLNVESDYTIVYSNNTNVTDEAIITVSGNGNFTDSFDITFKITALDISTLLTFDLEVSSYTFDGAPKTPNVINLKFNGEDITLDDVDVVYDNNVDAGTATVSVSLKDSENYTGVATETFIINGIPLSDPLIEVYVGDVKFEECIFTYTGSKIVPTCTLKFYTGIRWVTIPKTQYTISYPDTEDFINCGTKYICFTAVAESTNYLESKTISYDIVGIDVSTLTVPTLEDQVYTSKEITPEITVLFGETELTSNDYTYEYIEGTNVNVGSIAQVKVTAKNGGNFVGEHIFDVFEIIQNTEAEYVAKIQGASTFTYNGADQFPNVVVTMDGVDLQKDVDYEITYPEDMQTVGTKTFTIAGKGNFEGVLSQELIYQITCLAINDSKITVSSESSSAIYTGQAIELSDIVVKHVDEALGVDLTLNLDEHYTVSYLNNTNVGTATVVITAMDNTNYTGINNSFKFNIISPFDPSISEDDMPEVNVVITDIELDDNNEYHYIYTGDSIMPTIKVLVDGVELVLTTEYAITYDSEADFINASDLAKVLTIVGKGNYAGLEKNVEFYIDQVDISNTDLVNISGIPTNVTYTGSQITFAVIIKYQVNADKHLDLAAGTDYTITFGDNVEVGTDSGYYEILGTGNYFGTISGNFEITKRSEVVASLSADTFNFTGSQILVDDYLVFTVAEEEITLIKDVDFTLEYFDNINVQYENGLPAKLAYVNIKFIHSFDGTATLYFKINPVSINDYTVEGLEESYLYVEQGVQPTFTLKNTDGVVVNKVDNAITNYEVYYSNNTFVNDNATMEIKGVGNYTGSIVKTFKITQGALDSESIEVVFNSMIYSGSILTPKYNIFVNSDALNLSEYDITIKYYSDSNYETEITSDDIVDALTYYAVVSFENSNTSGVKQTSFTVSPKDIGTLSATIFTTYIGTNIELNNGDFNFVDNDTSQALDLILGLDFSLTSGYEMKDAGSYPITINGMNNYTNSLTTSYEIKKAELTITAEDKTSRYKEDILELTYLVTGEMYDDLGILPTTDATNESPVGEYIISINYSENFNYNITVVNAVYYIEKADIVVSFENQNVKWNGKVQMPSNPETIDGVVFKYYNADDSVFEGAMDAGEYSLKVVVSADESFDSANYNAPRCENDTFVFTIEVAQLISIKEDAVIDFMFIQSVTSGTRTRTYRKTYKEIGLSHGIDDVDGNEYGIDPNNIVIGQILPETNVPTFISYIDIDASNIRIYRYSNGRYTLLYDRDPSTLEAMSKRIVGTNWKIEYVVTEGEEVTVLDTAYLSVIGDTSGDGKLSSADFTQFKKYYVAEDRTGYSSQFALSVMLANRGSIGASDYSQMKRLITGNIDPSSFFYVVSSESDASQIVEEYTALDSMTEELDNIECSNYENDEVNQEEIILADDSANIYDNIIEEDVSYEASDDYTNYNEDVYIESSIEYTKSDEEEADSSSSEGQENLELVVQLVNNDKSLLLNEILQ